MTPSQEKIWEAVPKGGLSDKEREVLRRFCETTTLDLQAILAIHDLYDRYGATYVTEYCNVLARCGR